MAKAKVKTHKTASVQRKMIQNRRADNWANFQQSRDFSIKVKEVSSPHPFSGKGGEYEFVMYTVKKDNRKLNRK